MLKFLGSISRIINIYKLLLKIFNLLNYMFQVSIFLFLINTIKNPVKKINIPKILMPYTK